MSNADFFAGVRKVLGALDQTQVDSINSIMAEAHRRGVRNPDMLGYFLSTGWHEAKLRPVREGFAKTDSAARAHVRRHFPGRYDKPAGPYGHWYYGRGLVQLTWHRNYVRVGRLIGVDLEQYPDRALEPAIAARVLVDGMLDGWFNGQKHGLAYYLDKPSPDWRNARRTVNITDKWTTFRDTARRLSAVISKTPWEPEKPVQKPVQAKTLHETAAPEQSEGWLAALIRLVAGLFK